MLPVSNNILLLLLNVSADPVLKFTSALASKVKVDEALKSTLPLICVTLPVSNNIAEVLSKVTLSLKIVLTLNVVLVKLLPLGLKVPAGLLLKIIPLPITHKFYE